MEWQYSTVLVYSPIGLGETSCYLYYSSYSHAKLNTGHSNSSGTPGVALNEPKIAFDLEERYALEMLLKPVKCLS